MKNNSQWQELIIEDIKAIKKNALAMGPFGSNIATKNFVLSGVPVIRGVNLEGSKFNEEHFVYLTEEKANQLSSSNVFHGDIIFTHRGTLGQVAIIPFDAKYSRYVISQSQMKLSCNTEKANPFFVYYFFISPTGQHELLSNTSTTGVPAIAQPLTSLRNIPILLPTLAEQNKIVTVLSNLDRKITILNKINKNLEQIIQTIFKSWFIDFEGQTEFVDSELGEIPKGWEIRKFSEIADILSGGTPKTNIPEYWNGNVKWVSVADIKQASYISETEKTITELGVSKSNAKILPSETIVITARGTVGNCSMMSEPMTINQSCYGLRGKENIGQIFLFHLLKNNLRFLLTNVHGSVFDTITTATFDTIEVIIPPLWIIDQFESVSRPFFDKILRNQLKVRILLNIRDALIPKLMSGEIKV